MKFHITFHSRKNLALGIRSEFEEIVEAENILDAILKLYKTYEHIRVISFYKIEENNENSI